jgi:hypothetical protein
MFSRKSEKELAMVHQDYLLLVLVIIVLFFAKWETGHRKH